MNETNPAAGDRRFRLAGLQHPEVERFLERKANQRGNPERILTLEGLFEVQIALQYGAKLEAFFASPELLRTPETRHLSEETAASGVPCYQVSAKVFRRLSDREDPDGVAAMARLPIQTWPPSTPPAHLAILDGLEIPGNAGTILRSADGAGVDAVVFVNRKVRLTHPKMMHASLGACFTVALYDEPLTSVQAYLKREHYAVHLADAKGGHGWKVESGKKALVLGGEKRSFDPSWYDMEHERIKIPMRGRVDSLNVACAATVLFYDMTRESGN